jgi:mono/diheme cytochrome c family protein
MRRRLLLLLPLITPLSAQDGGQLYTLYCSACHAPDGKGATGGLFPPLAGSPWVAGDPDRSIKVILHGLRGPVDVLGKVYDLEMPPQGAVIPDDQIAAILTHVRSSWGNQAAAVTAETVKNIRAATADRNTPWTAAEILKLHPLPLERTALRNLVSQVYRGNWKHLPDFATLKPDSTEEEHDGVISLADSPHKDQFAMVWEGQLEVPATGEYLFSLDADDAARIFIDGDNILEVHGIGPMNGSRVQRSRIPLNQGLHAIRVEYLEYTGNEGISVGWRLFDDKQYQWLTDSKDTAPKARDPLPIEPVDGRPVIYRNFIAGTTPRAIGIGFPGGLNLAWSADHLAPELLWTGEFIDGTAKWLDRGTANNPPAGDNVVNLGSSRNLPAEARFKGYKLDPAGNPTFIVQIGSQFLHDAWRAETGALLRTLTLTGSDKTMVIPLGSSPVFPDVPSEIELSPAKPVNVTYRWKSSP